MIEQKNSAQNSYPSSSTRPLLGLTLAFVLATAAFFSGLHLGGDREITRLEASSYSLFADNTEPVSDASLEEFWRVWHLLEDKFVSASSTAPRPSQDEMVQGAIKGLVEQYGDPYTIFMPPQDAAEFEADISGNFSGVGMEVGIRDEIITVIAPLPETPAERAGIVAGDALIKIDGESTERMSIDEAVSKIRGEKGTEVVLTIYRKGDTDFRDITIVRDTIDVPTIKTEQRGDVFIISLYSFNALSEMKMQEALRSYVKSDAQKLILDLRGNPGGFLQSAVAIASYFLPTGKVVVRENFGPEVDEQVFRSQGRLLGNDAPKEIVVLIDNGSASAAEILAGALKEHEVATVIGVPTFGKGSVQELVNLPDGSSLKVTIARWLTPLGASISDGGLAPDITITRTPQQVMDGVDPQLEAALEWLAGNKNIAEKYAATTTPPVPAR